MMKSPQFFMSVVRADEGRLQLQTCKSLGTDVHELANIDLQKYSHVMYVSLCDLSCVGSEGVGDRRKRLFWSAVQGEERV